MAGDRSDDRPPAAKMGSLRGYLPLSDTTVTTRGQTLPGLIQERSSTNLRDIKRHRTTRIEDDGKDEEGAGSNADTADSVDDRLLAPSWDDSPIRRRGAVMGDVGQLLNTHLIRSMRLIGKSNNPRYRW